MPNRTTPAESTRKIPAEYCWLIAGLALAAAAVTLTLVGRGDVSVHWILRLGAAVAMIGWQVRAAETRQADALNAAVEKAREEAWWMGYATRVEEEGEGAPRVVHLRPRER